MKPPFDLAAVEAATVSVLKEGRRILTTHRYGTTDDGHVDVLLDLLAPPQGAMVLDAGCGVGEISRLISARRPDLAFILMNISAYQLAQCPHGEQYMSVLDDCHACMLNDQVADAVIFSSSLCQMDIPVALAEAHRVLRPGGILLINDMVRAHGDPALLEQAVAARVLPPAELLAMVMSAGFEPAIVTPKEYDDTHFQSMLEQAGLAELGKGIYPVVIRAIRKD